MISRQVVVGNVDMYEGDSSLTTRSTKSTTSTSNRTLPSIVDCNDQDSLFLAKVTKVVNDIIFPRKQFVILEEELDVRGKLATKCLQELNIDKEKWNSIRKWCKDD